MAGTFRMLHSNDLVWSRMAREYMMGEREPMTDLMAWNADATRMPYRMHSEYLRKLFLDNDLAEDRFAVDGKPVALTTVSDHVARVSEENLNLRRLLAIGLLTQLAASYTLTSGPGPSYGQDIQGWRSRELEFGSRAGAWRNRQSA